MALVLLTALTGVVLFRSSYTALRDHGPASWALSLMFCLLAAAAWTLTVSLVRSRRSTRAPQLLDESREGDAGGEPRQSELPPAGAAPSRDGASQKP